jgi:hypothetical protein
MKKLPKKKTSFLLFKEGKIYTQDFLEASSLVVVVEGIKALGAGRTDQDSNLGTTTIIQNLSCFFYFAQIFS